MLITIEVLGVQTEVEIDNVKTSLPEYDVGIMGYGIKEWKAYSVVGDRELSEEEYDSIPQADNERIESELTKLIDPYNSEE